MPVLYHSLVTNNRMLEAALTSAIRVALDPDEDPHLSAAVQAALLSGVRDKTRLAAAVGSRALWGVELGTRGGPDLLLVDDHDQVRVVVEHKRGARAQYTGVATIRDYKPFSDPVAQDAADIVLAVPAMFDDWHVYDDLLCVDHAHTQVRDGRRRHGLEQIDGYRAFPWWLAPPFTLPDPKQATWLLLDSEDRTATKAFPQAATAGDWESTGYTTFVKTLGGLAGDHPPVQTLIELMA